MATNKQKKEALIRMEQLTKALGLNPHLLEYLREGKIYYSYMVSGMFGCIDTIDYDPSNAEAVQKFEHKNGAYVYHVIESETTKGKVLSFLYVSKEKYEEDWEFQRYWDGYIASYVYMKDSGFGEFGDIVITSDNGAIVRTA